MNRLFVDEHAFKRGLSEEDIVHAWKHCIRKQYRGKPDEGQIAVVGYDRMGRLLQIVGCERLGATVIYHALTPPTKKVLLELGLERGEKWRL